MRQRVGGRTSRAEPLEQGRLRYRGGSGTDRSGEELARPWKDSSAAVEADGRGLRTTWSLRDAAEDCGRPPAVPMLLLLCCLAASEDQSVRQRPRHSGSAAPRQELEVNRQSRQLPTKGLERSS